MKSVDHEQGRAASPQTKASPPLRVTDAGPVCAIGPEDKDGRRPAGDSMMAAARIQAEVASKPGDLLNGSSARRAESLIATALGALPTEMATVGAGGELVPEGDEGDAPMLHNKVRH